MGERGHYPFGEVWYESGQTDKWKFTSYERDNESALDYAMFRYDSTRLGCFMTPDPINLGDPLGLGEREPPGLPAGCWIGFCASDVLCPLGDEPCPCPAEDFVPLINVPCELSFWAGPEFPWVDISWLWELIARIRENANELYRSNRQPGESFAECVLANANEATFGQHGKVLALAGVSATGRLLANINVGGWPAPGFAGLVGASILSNVFGVPGITALKITAAVVEWPIVAVARAAPYALAVEAGILLGSAIKCR